MVVAVPEGWERCYGGSHQATGEYAKGRNTALAQCANCVLS